MRITVWQDALVSSPKKTPALGWGISLFAVTHQGPAQGGKAGSSETAHADFNKHLCMFQEVRVVKVYFCNWKRIFPAPENVPSLPERMRFALILFSIHRLAKAFEPADNVSSSPRFGTECFTLAHLQTAV